MIGAFLSAMAAENHLSASTMQFFSGQSRP
jgi:hypothetical protein